MKRWHAVLLVLVSLVLVLGGYVYLQVRSLEIERLSDDLFVLRGFGGNVAVLRTEAGAVIVDSMTLPLHGQRIRATAAELTGADTVLLINTHYHLDHTHGNPAFEPGTRILSTERTLSHLKALPTLRDSSASPVSRPSRPRAKRTPTSNSLYVSTYEKTFM